MNINNAIYKEFSGVISILKEGYNIFQGEYGFADMANEIRNRIDTWTNY